MSFVIYRGEKKIGDLVTRVYGELRPEDAKRAEAALRLANPDLAKIRELRPGAVLVTPVLPGVRPAPPREAGQPAPETVAAVRTSFEDYHERLAAALHIEREAIAAGVTLTKSRELKALAGQEAEATSYLEQAVAALGQRSVALERTGAFVKRLGRVRADLEALEKKLANGG